MHELQQLQKDRRAQRTNPQAIETKQTKEAAPAPARPPNYVMSPGPEASPIFCSSVTPDTR
jgi:hypothetical protein